MRKQIRKIILRNVTTQNSFIDSKGYSSLDNLVDELFLYMKKGESKYMHESQIKLLELAKNRDINSLTLQAMADLVGIYHREKVAHHLRQLVKKGRLNIIDGKYKVAK